MSNGEPLDLYKLFMVVKEKGGYDAVCKDRLWDLVGEEYGLGVNVGSSVELVYSKHLSALETCLKNVADGKFPECGLVDDRVKFRKCLMEVQAESLLNDSGEEEARDELERSVCDCPDGRKLCGSNRVKGVKPESNGTELKGVYEHQDGRKLCGANTNRMKGNNPGSSGDEFDKACDYLDERKLCGTNKVKGVNPESNVAKKAHSEGLIDLDMLDHGMNEPILENLCNLNTEMDMLEESEWDKMFLVDASDAESNMARLSDGSKSNDDDDNSDEVWILDPSSIDKESFGWRRKRESKSELLSWVTSIAKNPCDPTVGLIPEKSKWKSYSSQEIWKQALLFREVAYLTKDFKTIGEQLNWKSQKMHPSVYDNRNGAIYNLRQRLKCDKRVLKGKTTSDGISSTSSGGAHGGLKGVLSPHTEDRSENPDSGLACLSLDRYTRVHIPVGPNHQAEVPEWTGLTYESDSKWLGTQIWPPETVNFKRLRFGRDPIGKGREDSCGCQVQGSIECIRIHVAKKRLKVKLELGEAFYQWNLHRVGEEVRGSWTEQEEKKFIDVVNTNPASLDKCFWDHLFITFPMKSREDLVSYYFNVFLLQRRAYQNRHTPDNIDSDDDESEFTPLRKIFGHQSGKSHSFILLSPKKNKRKRKNCK
ncbi:AT-rich interactive domain-containing protein 1, partial [Mucuna pruriens]